MIFRMLILTFILACLGVYSWLNPVAQRQIEDFHLVKVNNQGQAIEPWQGPWACVADKNTGLLWEVKRDDESIHDGYWTYSWFDGQKGIPNRGDCYFEDERCDVDDLIRRANAIKTCGVDDWRLPTTQELSSIVSFAIRPGEPTINKDYFPHSKKGDYWSMDADRPLTGIFAHLKTGARAVNFSDGKAVVLPYRNAAFVRLVSNSRLNKTKLAASSPKLNNYDKL